MGKDEFIEMKELEDGVWKSICDLMEQEFGPCDVYEILFRGKGFLLVGTPESGAIATHEQYENFLPSTAHLYPNGDIIMWGAKIGDVNEITIVKKRESCPKNP